MTRALGLFALVPFLPSSALVAQSPPAAPVVAGLPEVADDWRAQTVHVGSGGVWYAYVDQVVPALGQPEVVVADDAGQLTLLTVYSGQWTPHSVVGDGLWLAPSRPADVDARVPGAELYAAGRAGSVHQVTLRSQPFARFVLEAREIGHVAGEEFHAIVAADLEPGGPHELLVFGLTGAVYQVVAAQQGAGFVMRRVAQLPGRVRDVLVLPAADGAGPATMLGVSRSGHLLRMRLARGVLEHTTLAHEDCGLGRIARGPGDVVYVTRDDGVLLRLTIDGSGCARQAVYAGGQGLRGVAAGNFFADGREAVAVYGYDQRVHLIARRPDGTFAVDTVYRAAQRGHWLTAGELDGRNGTDELVATGFDGEVVLLSRPPGYGLAGVAVPAEERAPAGRAGRSAVHVR